METKIEYRLRPVTRYIVTRFESEFDPSGRCASSGRSTEHGEFDNWDTAYAVGYALAKAEHDRLGYPLDDERIIYPMPPEPATPVATPVRVPARMSLGDLPYDIAAGLRRHAAASGDIQLTAILDRDKVAVDALGGNRQLAQ
jgi:hypothetical protein